MTASLPTALQQSKQIVTEATTRSLVLATAGAAKAAASKKGCGNRTTCSMVTAGALVGGIDEYVTDLEIISQITDRRKDSHAWIPKGILLTSPRGGQRPTASAIVKPVEGASQLARKGRRTRASVVALALAPYGSVPKVDSSQRMLYLCLPPGSPSGPGGIQLHSQPWDVVARLCARFGKKPADVVVSILDRTWTRDLARQYRDAGATVVTNMACDLLSMVETASPVEPDGPVRIAVGVGGAPEPFLAVPLLLATGGRIMMMPIPAGAEMTACSLRNHVYDQSSMMGADSLLLLAGVSEPDPGTESPFTTRPPVPGVRKSQTTDTIWVTVMAVSPMLERPQYWIVEYVADRFTSMTLLDEGQTLDAHLLLRYLETSDIETHVSESGDGGEVEYFSWGAPSIAGLEDVSESELLRLLNQLYESRRIDRVELVSGWDTTNYRLTWVKSRAG